MKNAPNWDGKVSIEHQIDVHVSDLLQCFENPSEVAEVLNGLQYVIEYLIRGSKQRSLDSNVCDKLIKSLLLVTGEKVQKSGIFGSDKRPTMNAELAFLLFVDYCLEVDNCLLSVATIPLSLLKDRLRFGRRIIKPSDSNIFAAAIALLKKLTTAFPHYSDWRDFFYSKEISEAFECLSKAQFFDLDLEVKKFTEKDQRITLYPPPALYFDRDSQRVLGMFSSSEEQGLDEIKIKDLNDHFGKNIIPSHSQRPIWKMILIQFSDLMIMLLILTSVISLVIDFPHIESGLILALVVFLNVSVGVWQDYKSERTVESMKSLQIPKALVRRNGSDQEIPASELVPGDIVTLSEGDFVPADLRLVRVNRLEVVETILTGESVGVSKCVKAIKSHKSRKLELSKCHGNVFMGTMVSRGTALGVVVRTGANTEIGQIGASLNRSINEVRPSKLKLKMTTLTKLLVIVAIFLCLLVALIGLLRRHELAEVVRLSISLAVSVIPEGLVAILTVSISLAIRRLSKLNALVRRLNAIESLGSVSVAAADKTGTLTEGKMRVEKFWNFGNELESYKVCILCNNATIDGVGEPTEVALIKGCSNVKIAGIHQKWQRLFEIPFESERRMMSVICQGDSEIVGFVKGATESVLPKCQGYTDEGGQVLPLGADSLERIISIENEYSAKGLRVLALAQRRNIPNEAISKFLLIDEEEDSHEKIEEIETNLIFVGIVALLDPPRGGVAESIEQCHRAGIKVYMITGDHIKTATSIASQIGIFNSSILELSRTIRGRDIDLLSVEALSSLNPFPCVFARVSPQNKLKIVQALQKRGEIVAMTGDGVNDAPAINQADVGIAMGKSGTQITREAASLILLDDDFSLLVEAISQGRQMYTNVRLFLIYLLSCNSAEIWTVLLAMIIGDESPLSPMNILWANIIADIPPSMCLSLERIGKESLMKDTPQTIASNVLASSTWILIVVNGLALSILTLVPYTLSKDPQIIRRSESFVILIGLQLVLALFSRSVHKSTLSIKPTGNPWLFASVLLSFGLLIVGLYVPFMYQFLDLQPLGYMVWIKLLVTSMILFVVNEVTKLIIRKLKIA